MHDRVRKILVLTATVFWASAATAEDLTIGLASEPSSIDPHYHTVLPNDALSLHVFDRLIFNDERQNLVPGLAVSWKTVDDLTWEFKLRDDVKWHDGSSFSAEDVAFSLERAQNIENSPGSYNIYLKQIDTVDVVDNVTLMIRTETPFPLMPAYMSAIAIISKEHGAGAETKDYNSGVAAIGTGPYRFVEFIPGNRVVLERNDDYWGPLPEWDRVVFKPITNNTARVAALLAGDVDMIDVVPTTDYARLATDPSINVIKTTSNLFTYLMLDTDRDASPAITDNQGNSLDTNPFKDERVRKAVSKSINRRAIVDRVMGGLAEPADQLLPEGFFGRSPNLSLEEYDPEGARALLKEAGWGDGFGVTIHSPNDRYVNDAKIAQAIASMLTKVGIKTQVEVMPKNVYFPRLRKQEFSMMLIGWGSSIGEPSVALKALVGTYDAEKGWGYGNDGRFSNAELDATLEVALRTIDRQKYEQLLIKATDIAVGEMGVIPLHFQINTWATRNGLTYEARSDGYTLAHNVTASEN